MIDLDLSRYDSIATRFAATAAEASSFLKSGIATRNAAFNRLIDEIEQVALRSRAPMLLMGPAVSGAAGLFRPPLPHRRPASRRDWKCRRRAKSA